MNIFNLLTIIGGLAAIASFFLGSRALARLGDRVGGTWHGAFSFFVFLTILVAPLSN